MNIIPSEFTVSSAPSLIVQLTQLRGLRSAPCPSMRAVWEEEILHTLWYDFCRQTTRRTTDVCVLGVLTQCHSPLTGLAKCRAQPVSIHRCSSVYYVVYIEGSIVLCKCEFDINQ